MEKSSTDFAFEKNNNTVNYVGADENGTVVIPYSSSANLIHEIVHGGQIADGRITTNKGSNVNYYSAGFTPIQAEVEAYRAQYSFDSYNMPTTKANGGFYNLNAINPTSVRGIYFIQTDMLGRTKEIMPYKEH